MSINMKVLFMLIIMVPTMPWLNLDIGKIAKDNIFHKLTLEKNRVKSRNSGEK